MVANRGLGYVSFSPSTWSYRVYMSRNDRVVRLRLTYVRAQTSIGRHICPGR